jgi:hypothetical protein
VLCGRSGNDGVTGPESMRQRIRFDINQGTVADIFRKRKRYKAESGEKTMDIILLLPVLGGLKQLQKGCSATEVKWPSFTGMMVPLNSPLRNSLSGVRRWQCSPDPIDRAG